MDRAGVDSNEVWLVVAAGATFAAFPAWYATLFSGFCVALLLILVLLIVRVVSFEWREKRRQRPLAGDLALGEHDGSVGAPFLWGVALANLVAGVPLGLLARVHRRDGIDLFSAYTVTAGVAVVSMFALHGATYLSLRTTGDLRDRAVAHRRSDWRCPPSSSAAARRMDGRRGAPTATTARSCRAAVPAC